MSEAELRPLGVSGGGRLLSDLHHANDTTLCINNHYEVDEPINYVNDAGARRLFKLNVKKTKLLVINDDEDPPLWVRGEPIERVISFKYLAQSCLVQVIVIRILQHELAWLRKEC